MRAALRFGICRDDGSHVTYEKNQVIEPRDEDHWFTKAVHEDHREPGEPIPAAPTHTGADGAGRVSSAELMQDEARARGFSGAVRPEPQAGAIEPAKGASDASKAGAAAAAAGRAAAQARRPA